MRFYEEARKALESGGVRKPRALSADWLARHGMEAPSREGLQAIMLQTFQLFSKMAPQLQLSLPRTMGVKRDRAEFPKDWPVEGSDDGDVL